jgi:hypothetical protein
MGAVTSVGNIDRRTLNLCEPSATPRRHPASPSVIAVTSLRNCLNPPILTGQEISALNEGAGS